VVAFLLALFVIATTGMYIGMLADLHNGVMNDE
jgi:hypothetical protein